MDAERKRIILEERIEFEEHWVIYNVCKDLAKKRTEYSDVIKEILKPAIKDGKDQNNFKWTFIKRFYNNFKREMSTLCVLRIFCKFVFKMFLLFNCDDDNLMKKIIFLYHEALNTCKRLGLCNYCMHKQLPKHYYSEEIKDTRPILMKVNELEENIYKFTNRDFYSQLTSAVIYEGDYTSLHFLVKYGLSYLPDDLMYEAKVELQQL